MLAALLVARHCDLPESRLNYNTALFRLRKLTWRIGKELILLIAGHGILVLGYYRSLLEFEISRVFNILKLSI